MLQRALLPVTKKDGCREPNARVRLARVANRLSALDGHWFEQNMCVWLESCKFSEQSWASSESKESDQNMEVGKVHMQVTNYPLVGRI